MSVFAARLLNPQCRTDCLVIFGSRKRALSHVHIQLCSKVRAHVAVELPNITVLIVDPEKTVIERRFTEEALEG